MREEKKKGKIDQVRGKGKKKKGSLGGGVKIGYLIFK